MEEKHKLIIVNSLNKVCRIAAFYSTITINENKKGMGE